MKQKLLLFLPVNVQSGLSLPVTGSPWRLNLALRHKGSFFFFYINQILGALDFTIFPGLEQRAFFSLQSTDIQIVGKTQRKARATLHDLNDWNMLRALARNYQCYGVALVLQLRWYIGIFQFIDYSLHGWSRPRLSLQASPYQAAKHTVRYKHDLFFPPCRVWQFPDAHFTEKSTKAVDINLKTIIIHDFMPEYSLFTLLISGILITKRVKVTPEGESREFKRNRWLSING